MSPTSVSYPLSKVEHGELPPITPSGTRSATTSFQFGIRSRLHHQAEKVSVSALKVCKDSHRIRKPPLPLPRPTVRSGLHPAQLRSPVQYRAPIIIHTYSPEVIYTQPDDFMSLVQKLTGSCDTRHRLKRKSSKKSGSKKSPRPVKDPPATATAAITAAVVALEQQVVADSPGSALNCGSPSSSDDDSATVPDGLASAKQSNSPRGPLSNFEFDNTFTPAFEVPSTSGNTYAPVKAEPGNSSDSFNFFTGLKPLPKPENGQLHNSYFHVADINSPLPSPGILSPALFAGLPELSPGTAAWSQQFLDCLNGSPQLTNQPPLQPQRTPGTGGTSDGTMVALENIQAFMFTG